VLYSAVRGEASECVSRSRRELSVSVSIFCVSKTKMTESKSNR
jgi:hypothetical protein